MQCSRCAFPNHPLRLSCERCGKPLHSLREHALMAMAVAGVLATLVLVVLS